ncbi:PIN domain-containing protein [Pantoea ananatis]
MPLVTRNVFIDTEFFVKANLDFHSRTIKTFVDLCGDNELNHVTSTIVVQEVKRKITDKINDALKGVNNFRRKAAVLKNYNDESIKGLFVQINETDLQAKAIAVFDDFINASNASVVDMSAVDGNEIINMFFTQETPFSAKKPNEFRDAFSLLAIRSKLRNQEKIYVVSADPDHKTFCEKNDSFISIDTLSALLDVYNKHNDQRSKFVEEFLLLKREDIKTIIKVQLEQMDAYNSSTWEDAELDSFEVIEVGDFEPEIIHLDDESCQIRFEVDVRFVANVSGPDYVNGHYDKEDGVIHTFSITARQEEEEQSFSVELDLFFETDVEKFINDDFQLNIQGVAGGIEFSVEETPWEDPRM